MHRCPYCVHILSILCQCARPLTGPYCSLLLARPQWARRTILFFRDVNCEHCNLCSALDRNLLAHCSDLTRCWWPPRAYRPVSARRRHCVSPGRRLAVSLARLRVCFAYHCWQWHIDMDADTRWLQSRVNPSTDRPSTAASVHTMEYPLVVPPCMPEP